jgi:anti-sigma factor RsiW
MLTMESEDPPRVARHLLTCGECREDARRLAAEAELIRAAIAALPVREDFTAEVMARITGRRRG